MNARFNFQLLCYRTAFYHYILVEWKEAEHQKNRMRTQIHRRRYRNDITFNIQSIYCQIVLASCNINAPPSASCSLKLSGFTVQLLNRM